MDLYVERQCVDGLKSGNLKQFLMLFDACFKDLYKYVARRVGERQEVERIVRLAFFDAFGQARNTPTDSGYLIWLYSLAKPRIWAYLAKESFPEEQGLIARTNEASEVQVDDLGKFEKMLKKLSLEEREILKLKFFEQVSDGDVMTILGMEEGSVGPKIYRVLKRAHFLLFGESDERQGVYFGELSGFMERVRGLEEIEVSEVLALTLKNELTMKIEKKDFAIEGAAVEAGGADSLEGNEFANSPFEVKAEEEPNIISGKAPFEAVSDQTASAAKEASSGIVSSNQGARVGSDDPAKIFVEAVREMKEEEALKKIKEERKMERRENLFGILERWKGICIGIPAVLFVVVIGFVAVKLIILSGGVERGYPSDCEIEVVFEGEFSDGEMRSVNKGIGDRICGHFEDVESLMISRVEDGKIDVEVGRKDWLLSYNFVKKIMGAKVPGNGWKIKKYERTFDSNGESGEV